MLSLAEQAAVIRWEDPPPPRGKAGSTGRAGSKYDRLAVELITHAGRWALIHEAVSRNAADQLAASIRSGRPRCFAPAGDFDACSRTVDGRYRVYARYLGDGGDDA